MFSAIIICNQLHLASDVKAWTAPMAASIIASVLVYYTFALVYNAIVQSWVENPPYWVAETMMASPTYWLALFLIAVLAMLPRLTAKVLANSLAPPVVLLARLRLLAKQRSQSPPTNSNNFASNATPNRAPRSWLARFSAANPSVRSNPSSSAPLLSQSTACR